MWQECVLAFMLYMMAIKALVYLISQRVGRDLINNIPLTIQGRMHLVNGHFVDDSFITNPFCL